MLHFDGMLHFDNMLHLMMSETLHHCCDHYQSDQKKMVVIGSVLFASWLRQRAIFCVATCMN